MPDQTGAGWHSQYDHNDSSDNNDSNDASGQSSMPSLQRQTYSTGPRVGSGNASD